jgi:hypothetical protein
MRTAVALLAACLLLPGISSLDLGNPKNSRAASNALGRRQVLQRVAGSIAGGTLAEIMNPLQAMASENPSKNDELFKTYQVIPDASSSLKPRIKSMQVRASAVVESLKAFRFGLHCAFATFRHDDPSDDSTAHHYFCPLIHSFTGALIL